MANKSNKRKRMEYWKEQFNKRNSPFTEIKVKTRVGEVIPIEFDQMYDLQEYNQNKDIITDFFRHKLSTNIGCYLIEHELIDIQEQKFYPEGLIKIKAILNVVKIHE